MKKRILTLSGLLMCAIAFTPWIAGAEEDELAKQEQSLEGSSKKADYEVALKEKYKLTDEQLKKMHDQGMNNAQITIASQLSLSSGKPIDDIVKMRLEQKMGWGKIAKELGVPPREIGQSIASMHRSARAEERMEARKERREERRERREEKKQERQEKQHGHGHGKG